MPAPERAPGARWIAGVRAALAVLGPLAAAALLVVAVSGPADEPPDGGGPQRTTRAERPARPLVPADPAVARVAADERANGAAAAATRGGVRGRILSHDPSLRPPYRLTWTRSGGAETGAMRCAGEAFALADLAPGAWRLELRAWEEPPADPRLAGPAPERTASLGARTVRVEPGREPQVELWIGREPERSTHLVGYLEGERVDLDLAYAVALSVTAEDGMRVEERAEVDDVLWFDLGRVPSGSGAYELRASARDDPAVEDVLATGTVDLAPGERKVLVIAVPETSRVRFRLPDDARGAPTRVHWSSADEPTLGGLFLFPRRAEIVVPAGEYVAVAHREGFAAACERVDARAPVVDVELRLRPAPTRLVRLVDDAGAPVSDALLRVVAVGDLALRRELALCTRTNADGVFDASAFPAGRLAVEVVRRGGATARARVDPAGLGDVLAVDFP